MRTTEPGGFFCLRELQSPGVAKCAQRRQSGVARRVLYLVCMKTILAAPRIIVTLAAVGAFASPALADGNHAHDQSIAAKKPDIGASFDPLKPRHAALPTADQEIAAKGVVTERQVDQKVKDRSDDLEYCWLRVPAGKRISTTAIMHISIDETGLVSEARMEGELPAGVEKCMTSAAKSWRFAVTGSKCELEHAFTLNNADIADPR